MPQVSGHFPGCRSGPRRRDQRDRFWDFLFYTSFGFVVTSSVAIAGVLLVFSYLVVPSVATMLFGRTVGKRLALGWTMGALVSALGVVLSFQLDLPTGANIVCTFGIALAALALARLLRRAPLVRALERRHATRAEGDSL